MVQELSVLDRMMAARGEAPLPRVPRSLSALERMQMMQQAKEMGPFLPPEIPPELRAPVAPTVEGRGGYQIERAPQPMQPAPQTGNPVLDMFDTSGASLLQMGQALGRPGATFQGGIAPGVQTQIENVNNQTMQNATGKAQEAESMSDLGKMLRAYFGGRTKEEKQRDAFMNIAAGLAAGKSPRFMDNLGSAVSGAITYDRDADKGNQKEALDMMLKNQGQEDDRAYQQGMLDINRESNAISRLRVSSEDSQKKQIAKNYAATRKMVDDYRAGRIQLTDDQLAELQSRLLLLGSQASGLGLDISAPAFASGTPGATGAGWSLLRVD